MIFSGETGIFLVIGGMMLLSVVVIRFLSTPITKIAILNVDQSIRVYRKNIKTGQSEVKIKEKIYKVIPEGIFYHFSFLKNYRQLFYKADNSMPITLKEIDAFPMFQKMLLTKVGSDYLDEKKPDYQNIIMFSAITGIMGFVIGIMIHIG